MIAGLRGSFYEYSGIIKRVDILGKEVKMSKIKIIYWSQTGNTQAMAEAVAEGVREAGAEAELLEVGGVSADLLSEEKAFALGCPAMGAEVLEESEMEPFVSELEGKISGKTVALFGSYDWGDGTWMTDWVSRMKSAGASVVGDEGVICNLEPDAEGLAKCRELGKKLAGI